MSRAHNDRSDGYGGSLENRCRLLREVLEDAREAADGQAAIACRLVVDELLGSEGVERNETEALLGMLGELPDLWNFPGRAMVERFVDSALRT